MDKFLSLISNDDLNNVITGSFDVTVLPPAKHKSVFLMAAHCCLNGPVGTNKDTTFPVVGGPISISGYVGSRVSNNSWKAFCGDVARLLLANYQEIVKGCQQMSVAKGLWPLSPSVSEFRNKAK